MDYDDILSGEAYLGAVDNGTVGEHDTVLMFSLDGAQLYWHKRSDCIIYIWIILCQSPYFIFALFALLMSLLVKYLHSHPLYTFATSLSSSA